MTRPKRDVERIQVTVLREVAAELRRRARRNHRSLSEECAYLIDCGLRAEPVAAGLPPGAAPAEPPVA